ncbi:uncharacterized protein B0H18DRAFT_1121259 [Fomitopsis serialis]|uniref:uncharacterized protein n=1 Tax=Fomitopsis serialis TaxID=139415 RepID=UPI002007D1E6|nr:uncharacterized protein B0H18DRAFT_1121259 [Neoantrodia serialis]KAH9921803.1 hypothetical protein B0H18DRAFT_1121259 [Neoantrodia serialis]
MASTLTTESRTSLRDRRPAVPLLLSSFPLPPSHIPSSSSFGPSPPPSFNHPTSPIDTLVNPPPSRPPSTPLPPVPGPSPVSQHETLMLITAARSRRTSKMSVNSTSTYSRRSSTASSASASNSLPSLSPSASVTPGGESTRSLHSYPSNGSLAAPTSWRGTIAGVDRSPVLDSRIREEDPADLTRMSLDEIHDPEMSDDEKGLMRIGESVLKEHSHRRRGHHANDSISSIDMRDLPPLNEKEDEIAEPVPKAIPSPKKKLLDKTLPPLPMEPRRAGAESPDIDQILAKTPRPRRKSSGCPSRSVSRTRARSLRRHVSDGTTLVSSRSRKTSEDDSFVEDYGSLLDATGTPVDIVDVEEEEKLDRALDGEGSDSDSDIDIHTPLPNLMLRHGLLSPNSKLLPQSQSQPVDDRPGSHMSVVSNAGSVMTKTGLFKDGRDTVYRRVRHRDGKLLRGGIGLTTGLGWSDSEDEGAPSPLTHKLSSTTLGRKSLPASLRSSTSTSSSLSRHFNEMGLDEERRPRASLPSDLSRKPSTSSVSMPRKHGGSDDAPGGWMSFHNRQIRMFAVFHVAILGLYINSIPLTTEGLGLDTNKRLAHQLHGVLSTVRHQLEHIVIATSFERGGKDVPLAAVLEHLASALRHLDLRALHEAMSQPYFDALKDVDVKMDMWDLRVELDGPQQG